MKSSSNIEVHEKLGEGGSMFDTETKKEIAIKMLKNEKHLRLLKREYFFLKKLEDLDNFPSVYEFVSKDHHHYFGMQLLGTNLTCSKNFPLSTRFNFLNQMLNAIENLHNRGIVHQDIKPANFVLNVNPMLDIRVYLIDFGLAKIHIDLDGNVFKPNEVSNFVGTLTYASYCAHINKCLGRKDDLYSFFFIFLEFLDLYLPWNVYKQSKNKDNHTLVKEIGDLKQACLSDPNSSLFKQLNSASYKKEIFDFLNHLNSLKYDDKPNYEYIRNLIEKIRAECLNKDKKENVLIRSLIMSDISTKDKSWTFSNFFNKDPKNEDKVDFLEQELKMGCDDNCNMDLRESNNDDKYNNVNEMTDELLCQLNHPKIHFGLDLNKEIYDCMGITYYVNQPPMLIQQKLKKESVKSMSMLSHTKASSKSNKEKPLKKKVKDKKNNICYKLNLKNKVLVFKITKVTKETR